MTAFNEDSRVKIPALLHLTRLGFDYLSLKQAKRDARSNIFPEIFETALLRINPSLRREDVPALLDEMRLELQNEDLGKAFHKRLAARSGVRLIDFDDSGNNSYHAVTELPFENGEDNFRPDITLLINGLPLAIIEVKKRMNPGGVLEERRRMDRRHANRKFRHFFNLIQLQVFSNNYGVRRGGHRSGARRVLCRVDLRRGALQLLPRGARYRTGRSRRMNGTVCSSTPRWAATRAITWSTTARSTCCGNI